MQHFSIKDMERLSGIKAHTLRIWEQRYGILQPLRKEGNHRFYSNEDLKALLRVVFLYDKGHRIGEIARLSQDEIGRLLIEGQPNEASARSNILAFTEAILDFDEDSLDRIFHRITRQYGFTGAMLEIVFPLMNNLGQLWMSDRLSPGQEHFASNFILRKILHAKSEIERKQVNKPGLVMLFTPKGEYHELGLVFMSYLLRLNGFNTIYLGANTDIEIIELFYQRYRPTHLLVYLTGNLQDEEPDEYLERLVRQYPDARVVACGLVTRALQNIHGCLILRQGDDMLQFSRHLMDE